MAPTASQLAAAVYALLDAHPTLHVFRGDQIDEATIPADSDGRVYGYAVLWSGAGYDPHDLLNGAPSGLRWPCRITAVGGTIERCLWAADEIAAALKGRFAAGELLEQEPSGPDTVQIDRDVTPWRYYAPLIFGLRA